MVVVAGGADRIVGTDNFSDYPDSMKALPKVGDMQPNIELIVRLRPDLVFSVSSAHHPALAKSLGNVDIPLFVVRADRLDDIPRAVTRIGGILGTSTIAIASGAELVSELDSERRSRTRTPRVLFALWLEPLYVAGRETFVDDLIELTGGVNAVQVRGWPQLSFESLVSDPVDLIVIATDIGRREQLADLLKSRSPWRDLSAVKAGFWYVVHEDRFSRPGPRTVEAARDLNQVLDLWEQSQELVK